MHNKLPKSTFLQYFRLFFSIIFENYKRKIYEPRINLKNDFSSCKPENFVELLAQFTSTLRVDIIRYEMLKKMEY